MAFNKRNLMREAASASGTGVSVVIMTIDLAAWRGYDWGGTAFRVGQGTFHLKGTSWRSNEGSPVIESIHYLVKIERTNVGAPAISGTALTASDVGTLEFDVVGTTVRIKSQTLGSGGETRIYFVELDGPMCEHDQTA